VETESRMVLKHVLKAIVAVDHLFVLGRWRVKVKFTLEQATKAQSWSRGIALLFL
jgi:hypothetical protein